MIAQCPSCKTKLKIRDESLKDAGVKVRCTRCSTTFLVKKPAARSEPADELARTPPNGTGLPTSDKAKIRKNLPSASTVEAPKNAIEAALRMKKEKENQPDEPDGRNTSGNAFAPLDTGAYETAAAPEDISYEDTLITDPFRGSILAGQRGATGGGSEDKLREVEDLLVDKPRFAVKKADLTGGARPDDQIQSAINRDLYGEENGLDAIQIRLEGEPDEPRTFQPRKPRLGSRDFAPLNLEVDPKPGRPPRENRPTPKAMTAVGKPLGVSGPTLGTERPRKPTLQSVGRRQEPSQLHQLDPSGVSDMGPTDFGGKSLNEGLQTSSSGIHQINRDDQAPRDESGQILTANLQYIQDDSVWKHRSNPQGSQSGGHGVVGERLDYSGQMPKTSSWGPLFSLIMRGALIFIIISCVMIGITMFKHEDYTFENLSVRTVLRTVFNLESTEEQEPEQPDGDQVEMEYHP